MFVPRWSCGVVLTVVNRKGFSGAQSIDTDAYKDYQQSVLVLNVTFLVAFKL
jgi:hypothetical protein